MATKFYFHAINNNVGGTLPSGKQTTTVADFTTTGGTTNRLMDTGIGTAQSTITGTTAALSTIQDGLLGMWISPAMNAGTIGGGTINFSFAADESNAAANFWPNSLNIYVWRPSTGTKIGTVRDATGTSLGGLEVGTSETTVYISGITSSAVTMVAGDVIVVEVWAAFTQTMATSYTVNNYYNGTTENITNNVAATNHASFIQFTENVTPAPIVITISGNSTSSNVGDITPLITGNVTFSANSSVGSIGTLGRGVGYDLTSTIATGTVGTVTRSSAVTISVSGVSAVVSTANESVTILANITSISTSANVGTVTVGMTTGTALSSTSSSTSTGILAPKVTVSVSSTSSSISVGTIIGAPSATVSITATSSALTTNSVTRSSSASRILTGVSSSVLQGNETATININATGNIISSSVGTTEPSTTGGIKFFNPTAVSSSSLAGTIQVLSVTPPPYHPSMVNYTVGPKYLIGTVTYKWDTFNKESFPYLAITVSAKNVAYTLNRDIIINASIVGATGMQEYQFIPASKSTEFVVPDQPHTSN